MQVANNQKPSAKKTIKLNGPKATNGETPKEKKKVKTPKAAKEAKEAPAMTEKERLEKKEKNGERFLQDFCFDYSC